MNEDTTLALLHLARLQAAGELTPEQYENAQAALSPPPSSEEDAPANRREKSGGETPPAPPEDEGAAMPDEFADYDYDTELPGNKGLRSAHKALHAFNKAVQTALETIEEPDVRAHLGEHAAGATKALKAMCQLQGKKYKGTPPMPDDYPDEDEGPPLMQKDLDEGLGDEDIEKAVPGGMSYQDAGAGGAVVGMRPEDEEMSDEDAEHLTKSLPALERRLGLR